MAPKSETIPLRTNGCLWTEGLKNYGRPSPNGGLGNWNLTWNGGLENWRLKWIKFLARIIACSCMPGVRDFTPRAARSFSRKVPKLRLKQKTIRATSLLCCMQHAVLSWDRSTVLGNGIFWGTERAIKPENERFQLRTLGTGWSMKKVKKICFGTAGKAWKGGLKGRTYLYCHYTWVPPPPPPRDGLPPRPARQPKRYSHRHTGHETEALSCAWRLSSSNQLLFLPYCFHRHC